MKKILTGTFVFCLLTLTSFAQQFNSNLTDARKNYSSGNLVDSRAAMEQMLRDLDVEIGKEILKMLPAKMEALDANTKNDQVTSAGGGLIGGLYIQRTYGSDTKGANLDIINNSPLINSLQALLSVPFIAGAGNPDQKVVRVSGYKALLHKVDDTEAGKVSYELQIPLQNTLVTFKVSDTKEDNILKLASTIPLEKISQMAK
ncbi:hypothetical protein FVR03_06220 [Pontibacter qinzhouensis]|uniref:DUF4252 domain-containing protein n=1 Tax=Pontibacter qinzhouensis TaxID=2603253 RepID=A0A5C8K8F5_9BACT|nr:hypothetical protein [Pontibacter qinzhouensis]TXK49685.1 hypothetical protein FVR03_06220 [Pontibacter qinzhouensis]